MSKSKEVSAEFRNQVISYGLLIAAIRKSKNLSQEQLAEMAGISRSHLSRIEAAGSAPPFTIEVLLQISKALGVKPEDIIALKWDCIPNMYKPELQEAK